MFNNKKINIVISLLIAIALWSYVVGEINPTVTKTFDSVPITFINQNVLNDNGLAVVAVSDETVDVTLSGSRSEISQISNEDITAAVDLRNAGKGENQLSLEVRAPSKTELEKQSISKVTVKVEDSITKAKEIKVEYTGSFAENLEPTTLEVERETVLVTGGKSLVDKVDYVKATINSGYVASVEKTLDVNLVPVDEKGTIVDNVNLAVKTIKVKTIISQLKSVELIVPIEDNTADEVIKLTNTPKTVMIKGRKSDLEGITSIKTESVDISDITESTDITLTPILPDNVQMSDKSAKIIMKVTISTNTKKTFVISDSEITFTGLDSDLTASTSEGVEVTVEGSEEQLSKINKSDIKVIADLSGLKKGNHSVELKVTCTKKYSKISLSKNDIEVQID